MSAVDTHPIFLTALDDSQRFVAAVADWARTRGHEVRIPPVLKAPTKAEARAYRDGGDLFINGFRCEVKEAKAGGHHWTCAADFPFNNFLFEFQKKVDRYGHVIFAYFIVNTAATHAGIVLPETSKHWWIRLTRNPITGKMEPSYTCPTQIVKFVKLTP